MENEEKKENAPDGSELSAGDKFWKERDELPYTNDKVGKSFIRPWREPFYQQLRDLGIEVNDVTDEMEGKTTLITLYRSQDKSQPDKEQNLTTDIKNENE